MKGARSFPQMAVRLRPELKEWLAQSAASNHRSINSEVVSRLEESKQNEEARKEKSHG